MKDLLRKKEDGKASPVNQYHTNSDTYSDSDTHFPTMNSFFPIHRQALCACGGDCPRCQSQTMPAVSQPFDAAEIEADSVADKVMRMRKPQSLDISTSKHTFLRKPFKNETPEIQENNPTQIEAGKTSYRRWTKENPLSPAAFSDGRAMETKTREFMESRFNEDFGKVRIHDNPAAAAESASSIAAQAYTFGNDIVFNAGQYKPETESGKRLLAHELAHVVQQNEKIHRQSQPPDSQSQPSVSVDEQGKSKKEPNAVNTVNLESFDLLLASFKFISGEIERSDKPKTAEGESGIIPREDARSDETVFLGKYSYYKFLNFSLGKIYGDIQTIIQNEMEKVYKELAGLGESETLPKVYLLLNKIDKEVGSQMEVKEDFLNKKNENRKEIDNGSPPQELKVTSKDTRAYNPMLARTNITQSEFTEKGGRHLDFFDRSAQPPFVNIEFYDKKQKEGKEMRWFIIDIHRSRYIQLNFIRELYGIDKTGKKIAGAYIPSVFMPASKKFDLFSLEDWREFLSNRFDHHVNTEKKSRADAFMTIIKLLGSYMQAFTIHTPYNIEEQGDNYLTKNFPKALTGQLIQDCGIYALKTVYLLSLLSPKLNLKIQYIILPNHIGLIMYSDDTPTLIVHNEHFYPIPYSEAQFDTLSKENQRMILTEKDIAAYEKFKKNRKENDTSGFTFTIEQRLENWTEKSKKTDPQNDRQFMGELAAGYFIKETDMPFKIVDIGRRLYDPKLAAADIRQNLWTEYEKMMREISLFDEASLKKKDTSQFNLWYLRIIDVTRSLYKDKVLSFWNQEAPGNWKKLSESLTRSKNNNDEVGYLKALEEYRDSFNSNLIKLEESFTKLRELKDLIREVIRSKALTPVNRGTATTLMERSAGEGWRIALNAHLHAVTTRIANLKNKTETMSGGKDITPPFAEEQDKLPYIP